jgi:hypothetical protein
MAASSRNHMMCIWRQHDVWLHAYLGCSRRWGRLYAFLCGEMIARYLEIPTIGFGTRHEMSPPGTEQPSGHTWEALAAYEIIKSFSLALAPTRFDCYRYLGGIKPYTQNESSRYTHRQSLAAVVSCIPAGPVMHPCY